MQLCSRIGQPVSSPLITAAQLVLQGGPSIAEMNPTVEQVLEQELSCAVELSLHMISGNLAVS